VAETRNPRDTIVAAAPEGVEAIAWHTLPLVQ